MIRNQFSGETAKDSARQMHDLYLAGWALSNVAAPVDVEDYPNATVYDWLQSVSDAVTRLVEAARPVYQRLGVAQVPFSSLKRAADSCRDIEYAEFFNDASSPVGGCCGHCQPTGEGSPSCSDEGVA